MTFLIRSGRHYFAAAGNRQWAWWTDNRDKAARYDDRGKAERMARALRCEAVTDTRVESAEERER